MDGKRNAVLFTAAFFLLAFVLLGCTLGMQLSLRAELDALPAAQEVQTTADPAETLASADAPNEASLVLTQTQPAASIAEQPEMTGQTTSRSRTAAVAHGNDSAAGGDHYRKVHAAFRSACRQHQF